MVSLVVAVIPDLDSFYGILSNKGYGSPGYFGGNFTDNRSYKTTKRPKNNNTTFGGWGPYYW